MNIKLFVSLLISTHILLSESFNTYQSEGLRDVVKGIDDKIKNVLEEKGYKIKNLFNIRSREKNPQPIFRVELEDGDVLLKKNTTHPIDNLKFLTHRRITVEEPYKRPGRTRSVPELQEFRHTWAYCKLIKVCGELRGLAQCVESESKFVYLHFTNLNCFIFKLTLAGNIKYLFHYSFFVFN